MKRFRLLAPWIASCFGILASAYLFYPGYLTWDSAYQWWQVRNGLIDTTHPPIMVWAWGLTNHLIPGPGGYFLFQLGLYWLSLGLFVSSLRLGAVWQTSLVLLLGFWPPLWGLSLHLWKDVGTMSFFCLAAACFARDQVQAHGAWRIGALVAILLACMYRHNALPAALPFMIYGAVRHYDLHPLKTAPGRLKAFLYGLLACGLFQLLVLLPNHALKLHSEPLWPMQALWDIAAVSVQEDRLLIPPEWMDPGLTLDVVRRDFNPVFAGLLFSSGQIKLNPFNQMSEHDFKVLRKAWLAIPFEYPQSYWRHRFQVMQTLLGWQHDEANPNLMFHTGVVEYKDNPKVVPRAVEARAQLETAAHRFSRSVLFQGGWYLLLSLAILAVAARRKQVLMAVLAGSGLLYVLPLLVLAPSSDFRYQAWMLQASLLAMLANFIVPAGHRTDTLAPTGKHLRTG